MRTNKDILCEKIENNDSKQSLIDFIRRSNVVRYTETSSGELIIIESRIKYNLRDWASMHKKRVKDDFNTLYRRMKFLGMEPSANFDWLAGLESKLIHDWNSDEFLEFEEFDDERRYYWKEGYDGMPQMFRYFLKLADPIALVTNSEATFEDVSMKDK